MTARTSCRTLLAATLGAAALLLALPAISVAALKCGKEVEHHYYLDNPDGPGVNGSVYLRSCIQRNPSTTDGRAWVRGFVNVRVVGLELYESKSKGYGRVWREGSTPITDWISSKYATSPKGIGRAWGTQFLHVKSRYSFLAVGKFTYDVKYDGKGSYTNAAPLSPLA